jgi:hypothetical protein
MLISLHKNYQEYQIQTITLDESAARTRLAELRIMFGGRRAD